MLHPASSAGRSEHLCVLAAFAALQCHIVSTFGLDFNVQHFSLEPRTAHGGSAPARAPGRVDMGLLAAERRARSTYVQAPFYSTLPSMVIISLAEQQARAIPPTLRPAIWSAFLQDWRCALGRGGGPCSRQ